MTSILLCQPRLARRVLTRSLPKTVAFPFIKAMLCYPFFQVCDGEGQSLTTWKAWHIAAYLYFWWNYS